MKQPNLFRARALFALSIGPGISYRPGDVFNLIDEVPFRAYPCADNLPDHSTFFDPGGLL
jgi:hypothetical protein